MVSVSIIPSREISHGSNQSLQNISDCFVRGYDIKNHSYLTDTHTLYSIFIYRICHRTCEIHMTSTLFSRPVLVGGYKLILIFPLVHPGFCTVTLMMGI